MTWKHIGYTINEALGYGVPIVTTPLSILKELPITDNEHIVLDWDCKKVDEVAKQIFEKEVTPFKYKIPVDGWNKLLAKGKSTYQQDLKTKEKVQCIKKYYDVELKKTLTPDSKPFEVSKIRAEYLVGRALVERV